MNQEKSVIWTLAALAILTVVIVCILSFVLSYDALWSYALAGGKPPGLAWLWPLIIDVPIIAFSLVALLFIFLGMNATLTRLLVLAVVLLTIGFNYRYAVTSGLDPKVAVIAPIMYAGTFEALIIVIGILTKRSVSIRKIEDIGAELVELQEKRQSEQANLEAEKSQWVSQFEQEKGQLTRQLETERGNLKGQLAEINRQIEAAKEAMGQVKRQQKEQDQGAIFKYLPANLSANIRQEMVKLMSQDGVTIRQQAEWLRVSETTIKNDRAAIAEATPAGNNGHQSSA